MPENVNPQQPTPYQWQPTTGQSPASGYPPPPPNSQYPPPGQQYPPPGQYPLGPQYGMTSQQKPNPLWALSIISFLFSYLFGGIALYYSYQVGKRWDSGDAQGAVKASKNAKIWGIIGLVIGVIVVLAIAGGGGNS